MTDNLSVADAIALRDRDGDGIFGGSDGGALIFFLFALMMVGGGGFGGFGWGGNGAAFMNGVSNDFMYTNLNNTLTNGYFAQNNAMQSGFNSVERGLDAVNQNICRSTADINQNVFNSYAGLTNTVNQGVNTLQLQGCGIDKSICQATNALTGAITGVGFGVQSAQNDINRNIDGLRFQAERDTCDLKTAIHAEAEQTRALMTANVMQELRDQVQSAELLRQNEMQTQQLIAALQPTPRPAYLTCSPYASMYPNMNGYCNCNATF